MVVKMRYDFLCMLQLLLVHSGEKSAQILWNPVVLGSSFLHCFFARHEEKRSHLQRSNGTEHNTMTEGRLHIHVLSWY